MLIIDDILLFPVRSVLWIFREVHKAAQQELATEADAITAELSELYMLLETGRISQEKFDAQEKELLDRLDKIHESGADVEEEKRDTEDA